MTKTKYPKLGKVFKRKWIAALRSGKYKQGRGTLFSKVTDTYCCLGVACRVSGAVPDEGSAIIDSRFFKNADRVTFKLHGDTSTNPLVAKLVLMNDGFLTKITHRSFKQIANWINKNL